MKRHNWTATVPLRAPDASKDKTSVWFDELVIQRDYEMMYSEYMYLIDGLLCFDLNEYAPSQRTHAGKWIQEAYKEWLNVQIEALLLDGRKNNVGDT